MTVTVVTVVFLRVIIPLFLYITIYILISYIVLESGLYPSFFNCHNCYLSHSGTLLTDLHCFPYEAFSLCIPIPLFKYRTSCIWIRRFVISRFRFPHMPPSLRHGTPHIPCGVGYVQVLAPHPESRINDLRERAVKLLHD